MKISGLIMFLAMLFPALVFAQNNAISIELGGKGVYNSLQYERQIWKIRQHALSAGLGVGGYYSNPLRVLAVPVFLTALHGMKKISLEYGIGASYNQMYEPDRIYAPEIDANGDFVNNFIDRKNAALVGFVHIGLRYLITEKVFLRCSMMPMTGLWQQTSTSHTTQVKTFPNAQNIPFNHKMIPWVGVGVGYIF